MSTHTDRALADEPMSAREDVYEAAQSAIDRSRSGEPEAAWEELTSIPERLPPGSRANALLDQAIAAYSDGLEAEANHLLRSRDAGDDAVAVASYDVFREKLRELQQLADYDGETSGFETAAEVDDD